MRSTIIPLLVLLVACGEKDEDDTGASGFAGDGGTTDGGSADGGSGDGGSGDGGSADGGSSDGGTTTACTAEGDRDCDGLSDVDEETIHFTDPDQRDTDADGQTDGAEVAGGSNPLSATSLIDGVYAELAIGDTATGTADAYMRLRYLDIAFVVDTSAGMEIMTMALGDQVDTLNAAVEPFSDSRAWGFASFEDYAYGTMGLEGYDLPFHLEQEVTTSRSTVADMLTLAGVRGGGDDASSSLEALTQAATGRGYDQDCDGVYDATTDILPYIASKDDPFGGTAGQLATSAALGSRGGMGFRTYALPITILGVDSLIRDPSEHASPEGCPGDAQVSDVVRAGSDLGGYVIGACVASGTCESSMADLSAALGSTVDFVTWGGDADDLGTALSTSLTTLLSAIEFERVEALVDSDPEGMIYELAATSATSDSLGGTVTWSVDLIGTEVRGEADQVYVLDVRLMADEVVQVGDGKIVIVVPWVGA